MKKKIKKKKKLLTVLILYSRPMKYTMYFLVFSFFFLPWCIPRLHSTLLEVSLDGSQPYPSIQSAMNASTYGDTVLVHPGTYYENVNFNGHSGVTLASLEILTEDPQYIDNTIINGNRNGSCVIVDNLEQDITIRGLSITNGSGSEHDFPATGGGGIFINNEYGVSNSTTGSIINCNVFENYADYGGGIFIGSTNNILPEFNFSGVDIFSNYATLGGGLRLSGSCHITFDPENRCSIFNNIAGNAQDIAAYRVTYDIDMYLDNFTIENPESYYFYVSKLIDPNGDIYLHANNYVHTEINSDFYIAPDGDDSNSGTSPDQPMQTISRAMHKIASDSLNPKTVYVAAGTYSNELNGQLFPIPVKENVSLIGEDMNNTILYNDFLARTISNYWVNRHTKISNLTLDSDPDHKYISVITSRTLGSITIKNVKQENFNYVDNWNIGLVDDTSYPQTSLKAELDNVIIRNIILSGGVAINAQVAKSFILRNSIIDNIDTSPEETDGFLNGIAAYVDSLGVVDNCIFSNCDQTYPDAWDFQPSFSFVLDNRNNHENASYSISNCLFYNNNSITDNVFAFNSTDFDYPITISNCTFSNNNASLATVSTGNSKFYNCIFSNDTPYEIILPYDFGLGSDEITIDYCLLPEGENDIFNEDNYNMLNYGENNLVAQPLFAAGNWNLPEAYELSENSPAINAGTPDTTGLHIYPYDLNGNNRIYDGRIDMGCFEYGSTNTVEEINSTQEKNKFFNYPNPFSLGPSHIRKNTTFNFTIKKMGLAEITIYNIKGQKIKCVYKKNVTPGTFEIEWTGINQDRQRVASGIYLSTLKVNGHIKATNKILVVR